MTYANALSLAAALGLLATTASAQATLDVESLQEIGEMDVVRTDGTEVGEIEDVMVDPSGNVLVVVEVDGFGFGDDDAIFALNDLTFQDGSFVTALGEAEIEALPRYDD